MKLGDLVHYQDRPWMVRRFDPQNTMTATLLDAQGRNVEVPFDSLDCRVVANPSTEWPFVIVKDNPRGRFLTGLTRVLSPRKRAPLLMFVDWVPSDPARPGGSVFVNPAVGLQAAETLLVSWSNGPDTSLQVPVHFATVGQRVAREIRKRPPEITVFDHLLEDRFDEDA